MAVHHHRGLRTSVIQRALVTHNAAGNRSALTATTPLSSTVVITCDPEAKHLLFHSADGEQEKRLPLKGASVTDLLGEMTIDVGYPEAQRVSARKPGGEMHWKKYAYWLSGFFFLLATIIVVVMDWGGPISTDPLSWGSIVSELGIGTPLVFIGLDLMLSPEGSLNWLARHLPRWRPPVWNVRFFGCCLLLTGVLFTVLGISVALDALRTSLL